MGMEIGLEQKQLVGKSWSRKVRGEGVIKQKLQSIDFYVVGKNKRFLGAS